MNFTNLPTSITQQNANTITEILSVFENGHKTGNYDAFVAYRDAKYNNEYYRQITYGRFQTTEFGNLKKLIEIYIEAGGIFATTFIPFVSNIGTITDRQPQSLYQNTTFIKALKDAGSTDPIMQTVQELFFEKVYFTPALSWFSSHGFNMPLALLVIFDSFIHSGGILQFLRNRFSEYPPSLGGSEKDWIVQYVATRHAWLANYDTKETRASKYRTQTLKNLIADQNWQLDKPFITQGVQF